MNTAVLQSEAIAANRERDHMAFEWWERERILRDEITDQAERLAAPMENSFEYDLTEKGIVTDIGEPVLPVIENGLKVAQHQAEHNPDWQFELNRCEIELEEQLQIEDFARQNECGIRVTSFSLDQSNYDGMRAIAHKLGHELPPDRMRSEDILRNRMWLGVPPGLVVLSPIPDAVRERGVDIGAYDRFRLKMLVRVVTLKTDSKDVHEELINEIRQTYDDELGKKLGGKWYAGRQDISRQDARAFIEKQAEWLEAHVEEVFKVYQQTKDPAERLRLLEWSRYSLAAALDDLKNGKQVVSVDESGEAARAEGKEFKSDCPTAQQTLTISEQMEALGYLTEPRVHILRCVNCPFCKRIVDAVKINKPGEKTIECKSCNAKVDLETGERLDIRKKQVKKLGKTVVKAAKIQQEKLEKSPKSDKNSREKLVLGGTVTEEFDKKSGKYVLAV